MTPRAVQAADVHELLEELFWVRVGFYVRIAKGKKVKFLRGWLLPVIRLRESAR